MTTIRRICTAWLAVWLGAGGYVSAQHWYWANPMPHGNNVVGMADFNGYTIQVADLGQLYTSQDLQNWTPSVTGTTNALQAITVFRTRVIVTGESGTVLYSDDGVDYTYTNLATPDWLVAVAASDTLAVAVGDEAAIYTSTDGANWTRQAAPPGVGGNWLQGVGYGNGTFVAVGEGGYIATSTNGTNWQQRTVSGFSTDLNYAGWLDTPASGDGFPTPCFVVLSDTNNAAMTSSVLISTNNGASWYAAANFTGSNSLYGAAANADSWLLAGEDQLNTARQIGNALIWPSQIGPLDAPSWPYYCNLWETNVANGYLASGDAGMTVSGVETNGVYAWNSLDNSVRSWIWQMTTNAGLYIAVGDDATILTSDDGMTWTPEAIPYTNSVSPTNTVFFGVGGNTNLLIAVGNGGTTVLSSNTLVTVVTTNTDGSLSTNTVSTIGVLWNPVAPTTTNDLHGVAFFSNDYFISGGNGTILSSPNGQSWTPRTSGTTAYLSGLAAFSGGMVAVGDMGTILSSPNGTTWTARSSGVGTNWIYHVRYLGGTLIAVGENGTILTSTNGTAWTKQASGTTQWLNDVTMVTNTYYIVGNSGTVLASTDAATWTNVPIITGKSLYGVATQGGQLVVGGIEGVILQSQIVPALTPVSFLDVGRTPNTVAFLVTNAFVDQQFTLDFSTNLVNWTTGPLFNITDGSLLFYETLPTNAPPNQYYRTTLVVPP
jgi:hypothetical protein